MEEIVSKLTKELVTKRDEIIKQAIEEKGFGIDVSKMQLISRPQDEFEHLYYVFNEEKVRIISISKNPTIRSLRNSGLGKNNVSIEAYFNYY